MKYQKGFAEIRRERAAKRLRRDLLFLAGVLAFLVLLGLVGAVAR